MEINPYKRIRLQENLTQKEVARDLGITSQVVLRVEQGLFSAPPPALTSYLAALANSSDPTQLSQDYYAWVYAQRYENSKSRTAINARQHFANFDRVTSKRVAWKDFRKNILGLSVAATAKLLVMQISLIQDLEKTGRNAIQVQDILLNWGIPLEAINYLPGNVIKQNNLTELM